MTAADDDGGGTVVVMTAAISPIKLSPPTNYQPTFYRLDALPDAQPTVSKH